MQEVARFEKVSLEEYIEANKRIERERGDWVYRMEWEDIKQPTRATSGSAGYDFYAPYSFDIPFDSDTYNEPPHILTGIRCKIEPGWFLMCCPKSGLGFKYGMRLSNTIGIIDSDYYFSDNEGHIQAKFSAHKPFSVNAGQKFMQGIFIPYGITCDDHANAVRNGGFGSTGA